MFARRRACQYGTQCPAQRNALQRSVQDALTYPAGALGAGIWYERRLFTCSTRQNYEIKSMLLWRPMFRMSNCSGPQVLAIPLVTQRRMIYNAADARTGKQCIYGAEWLFACSFMMVRERKNRGLPGGGLARARRTVETQCSTHLPGIAVTHNERNGSRRRRSRTKWQTVENRTENITRAVYGT